MDLNTALKNIAYSTDHINSKFEEVAKELMNGWCIKRGGSLYEIVEIEFYLYNNNHPDCITYPRNMSQGRWFFHKSGVDITFESDENCYGGILIRGIKSQGDGRYILGPFKCVEELWPDADAFRVDPADYPQLIKCETNFLDTDIESYKRWIPSPLGENPYTDSKYRFIKVHATKSGEWKEYRAKRLV